MGCTGPKPTNFKECNIVPAPAQYYVAQLYKNANARTSHCMQKGGGGGGLEYKIKTEETK